MTLGNEKTLLVKSNLILGMIVTDKVIRFRKKRQERKNRPHSVIGFR